MTTATAQAFANIAFVKLSGEKLYWNDGTSSFRAEDLSRPIFYPVVSPIYCKRTIFSSTEVGVWI